MSVTSDAAGPETSRWPPLDDDRVWMAGVGVVSALIFASTFSPAVAGGDAPESVAGVGSIGILHAPGYPAYVLAARLFSWLVPFGDLAFRVNLFSAVCAVGAVMALFALGRRVNVPRPAAAFGALSLATATSFWFYAGFAKFYPLTWLLLIATALLVLQWIDDGRLGRILAAGALLGLATGASYQVAVLVVPGLVLAMALSRRRRWWAAVGAGMGATAVVSAALWAFVYVRAGQDPALNWGEATTMGRLIDLVSMRDFGWGSAALSDVGRSSARVSTSRVGALPDQIGRYTVLLSREFSVPLLLLALLGAWKSASRIPRTAASMLWAIFGVNVVGALAVVGMGTPQGFGSGLRFGGFLLAATFVAALWAGIGAWAAADALGGFLRRRATRGDKRSRKARLAAVSGQVAVASAVAAAVVLVPQVIVHSSVAEHPGPIVADYVEDVFATVEDDGVLLVWSADALFPFQYAQVVEGARPDVDVLNVGGVIAPWYREQLERRYELELDVPRSHDHAAQILMDAFADRPVYLEKGAWANLSDQYRTRPAGLVGEVLDGEPGIETLEVETEERLLHDEFDHSELLEFGYRWPYQSFADAYATAHLRLARTLAEQGRPDETRRELEIVLELVPEEPTAIEALAALDRAEGS